MSRAAAVRSGAIELYMSDGTTRRAELDATQAIAAMDALDAREKRRRKARCMTRADDLKAWEMRARGRTDAYIASVLGVSEAAVANAVMRVECGRHGEVAR